MPFYEYECGSCGHYHEALQKISDAPLRKCPACGRQTLKRLVSAPVFRLKGAGWYETDFKSEQERKRNLAEHADKEPAADKEKAAESKPDTKEPAAKAEPATAAATAKAERTTKSPAAAGKDSSAARRKRTPAARGKTGRARAAR